MLDNLEFEEKFEKLRDYYKIESPKKIRPLLRQNENIFLLLEEVKPYLEESFSGAEFCLEKNFEPEIDDHFVILRINVSEERYNNGIGDELREFDQKTKQLWRNANICRELTVLPGILDV
ncbi:MAG: hypothetical protein IJ122_00485 [Methanobrevibacter sp.]|nr:hypothetical protein [Methanobrevibacter sp.]